MKQIILALPGPLSPGAESVPSASPWTEAGPPGTSSHPRSRLRGSAAQRARRALTLSGPIQSPTLPWLSRPGGPGLQQIEEEVQMKDLARVTI